MSLSPDKGYTQPKQNFSMCHRMMSREELLRLAFSEQLLLCFWWGNFLLYFGSMYLGIQENGKTWRVWPGFSCHKARHLESLLISFPKLEQGVFAEIDFLYQLSPTSALRSKLITRFPKRCQNYLTSNSTVHK